MKVKEVIDKFLNIKINFLVLGVILIGIFSFCLAPVTFQNDTYYTIKVGEYIFNNGIDMMDHFSWHENLAYTYPHWLYDLLTYIIYSFSGFKGIYICTCILSSILGISIFLVNSKLTKQKGISFIVTIGALYFLQDYIAARAQLFTFIIFIWEIYFIENFLESKKIKYALALMASSLIIANVHVATWPFFFILFMPYIGEYIVANLADFIIYNRMKFLFYNLKMKINKKDSSKVEKIKAKISELEKKTQKVKEKREELKLNPYKIIIKNNSNVKYLIIIMIVCILMGFLTPIKDTPYTYLYKTMQGNTTKNISEHLPMTLANDEAVMVMLVVFLAILMFTKTKIRLNDLFMISGLCFLMLMTKRQLSMFVLISSVVLVRLLIELVFNYTDYTKDDIDFVEKNILGGIALIVLIMFLCVDSLKPKLENKFVDESSYPVEACDYILDNINLENTRFFNEYNFGSYMLYRNIPVFIDSRADLYTPEFSGFEDKDIFTDFIKTSSLSQFYEDTFEKYSITHVLCTKKSKINSIITKTKDENYKELYSDDNFVIYERVCEKSDINN